MWSDWLVFCDCGFHSVCPLMDKDKRLVEASWYEGLAWGNLGLVLMGGGILSKSLFQFSVDEQGCVPFLFFGLRPNYGRDNGDLLHKGLCQHCYIQYPWPCSRPLSTHTSAWDSRTLTGNSSWVSCGVTDPFSWVLVYTRFCLCPQRVCFPSPVEVL